MMELTTGPVELQVFTTASAGGGGSTGLGCNYTEGGSAFASASVTGLRAWDATGQPVHVIVSYEPGGPAVIRDEHFDPLICPEVLLDPLSVRVPPGTMAQFSISAAGEGPLQYAWECAPPNGSWLPMVNGIVPQVGTVVGAHEPTLGVVSDQTWNHLLFRCVVSNACGLTSSQVASLDTGCSADLDDGSGSGTPDGGVTIDDLLFFLTYFANGSIAADVDDGSGTGLPDGGVTIDDLIYYLTRFEGGC